MELQKRTYTYTPFVNDAVRHRVKHRSSPRCELTCAVLRESW